MCKIPPSMKFLFLYTLAQISVSLRFADQTPPAELMNTDTTKERCWFHPACSNGADHSLPAACVSFCNTRTPPEPKVALAAKSEVSQHWCQKQAGCQSKIGGFPVGCNPWCAFKGGGHGEHSHHSHKHGRRRRKSGGSSTSGAGFVHKFVAKYRLHFTKGFKDSLATSVPFKASIFEHLTKHFKFTKEQGKKSFSNLVRKVVGHHHLPLEFFEGEHKVVNTLAGKMDCSIDVQEITAAQFADLHSTLFAVKFSAGVAEIFKSLGGGDIEMTTAFTQDTDEGSGSGSGMGSGSAESKKKKKKKRFKLSFLRWH